MQQTQIESAHYDFARYVSAKRWASYWHQVRETLALRPETVLEIGVGTGIYRSVLRGLKVSVSSLDINPALQPDHVGSVTRMPFADNSFSVVVAFQVLEHLSYDEFVPSVSEMRRVAASHVVLSLPDARKVWTYLFTLPWLGECRFHVPKPRLRPRRHRATGQHLWEISKRGYDVRRIVDDLQRCGLQMVSTYRAPENPYHRFFVCRKVDGPVGPVSGG